MVVTHVQGTQHCHTHVYTLQLTIHKSSMLAVYSVFLLVARLTFINLYLLLCRKYCSPSILHSILHTWQCLHTLVHLHLQHISPDPGLLTCAYVCYLSVRPWGAHGGGTEWPPGLPELCTEAQHGTQTYQAAVYVEGGAGVNPPRIRVGTVQHQLISNYAQGHRCDPSRDFQQHETGRKASNPRSWLVHVAITRGHVLAIGHV